MRFIRLSFRCTVEDPIEGSEAAGLPLRGPSGRIYVLHGDGTVTQHPTTQQAAFTLRESTGAELLLWLVEGQAVAAILSRRGTRLECHLDVEGAPTDEQRTIARAVSSLLPRLAEADIEATLD